LQCCFPLPMGIHRFIQGHQRSTVVVDRRVVEWIQSHEGMLTKEKAHGDWRHGL
jgi:hypothetical protein